MEICWTRRTARRQAKPAGRVDASLVADGRATTICGQGGALSKRAVSYPAAALTCLRLPPKMAAKRVDLGSHDWPGVKLKVTYYSAGKPGPGVLLLHQCNWSW